MEYTKVKNSRSFIIPVLDMSPASPYNISKLLEDLKDISGDVIVIFNSTEMAEKLKNHPRIDYYASMSKNVGVSRAWNIGLNIAQTPVAFILNSDLSINRKTVETLEEYLFKLPNAAVVGPQGSFFNYYKTKDLVYFDKNSFKVPIEVDAVSGFLFAVKTELFNNDTLKFDNRYTPCYFEEWDLGLQIKFAGLKSYIIPVTDYNHEWSGSIRALKTIKYLDKEETAGDILNRNRTIFLNKWNELIQSRPEEKDILISNWWEIMLNNADLFIQRNEKEKALDIYNKIIEQYPDNIKALSKLSIFLYRENMLESALKIFERISKIDPNHKLNLTLKVPNIYSKPENSQKIIDDVKSYNKSFRNDLIELIQNELEGTFNENWYQDEQINH